MKFYVLVLFLSIFLGRGQAQGKPLLIDCGSNSTTNLESRKWVGDSFPSDNFTLSSPGIIASISMINGEPTYGALYKTARVFDTTSTYKFNIIPGNCYIRLHFCPFLFENFNANESLFDVMIDNLTLVSKYNVPGEVSWRNTRTDSNATSLVKEYFLIVSSSEFMIHFVPQSGSFAFVNAIELIPVNDNLFADSVLKVDGTGLGSPLSLVDKGMETMYRLNVGGPRIDFSEDRDLWRRWESDEKFMFSLNAASTISNTSNISYASANDSIIAPLLVYETARIMTNNQVVEKRFNVSWKFIVDPSFEYLVRLHFCELFYDQPNQRIFRIYINNKTAANNYDVFARAGGSNKAYHEDYIDGLPQQIDTLWLQLGPDSSTSASGTDALLNGLEIFKISRNGNLAHPSERIGIGGGGGSVKKPKNMILWVAIVVVVVTLLIVSIVCVVLMYFFCRKKRTIPSKSNRPGRRPRSLHGAVATTTNARASRLPLSANGSMAINRAGRRFSLAEIRAVTMNFDDSLVIGNGGFGKVYKGEIEDGTLVAIKRSHPESDQGLAEFETEIEMLSKLRHRHLVSMIGYCEEQKEMILVYEYVANGTLRSHLFGSDLPPLTWKQRMDACIGAARGLHYLHTGAERGIIHRDVKTTNILLDENFVAKIADFGLSKDGPALNHTHVSTAVKGSFGYLDPEYFRKQQLTQKSDVYSFGVVLFEVVCARPVINPSLPKDQINLAEWAISWQRRQALDTIVDPRLEGNYSLDSLKKLGEIAEKCLADEGKDRPSMGDVLWHLEYALQLYEAYTRSGVADSSMRGEMRFSNISLSLPLTKEGEDEARPDQASISEGSVQQKREDH